MMCVPTNPFVLNKETNRSDTSKNCSSSRNTKNHEIILVDCCSFLGLGLGIDGEFLFLTCNSNPDDDEQSMDYSFAKIEDDDDDSGDSTTLEYTVMGDESWTLLGDASTFDTLDNLLDDGKNEKGNGNDNEKSNFNININKKEEDAKTLDSACTTSILLMENIVEDEIEARQDEEDEESKTLVLLTEYIVEEDTAAPEDEEESKTLNTRSTMKLPPSLDTKTWDLPLPGLEEVETREDKAEGTRRNHSCPSLLQPRSDYLIERVPYLIDTSDNDDISILSSLSVEEGLFLDDVDGNENEVEQKIRVKRFAEGQETILKSPCNKKTKKYNDTEGSEQRGQHSFESISPRTVWTEVVRPTLYTEASKATIINVTKSADITATTVCTDDDEYYEDNVPFDEPHSELVAFSGSSYSRLMPIEEIRIAQ